MKSRVQTQNLNSKMKHRGGTGKGSVSHRTRAGEEQSDNVCLIRPFFVFDKFLRSLERLVHLRDPRSEWTEAVCLSLSLHVTMLI